MERYLRNYSTISKEEQEILKGKKVLILGAGGLGGYVCEGLARIGVLNLGISDYDVFDVTNLNRQLISTENNLGCCKSEEARKRINAVNSEVAVTEYGKFSLENERILNALSDYDLVVDCLDNNLTKYNLQEECIKRGIKVIHGSIAGNYGHVGVIDKDNVLLRNDFEYGIEKELGNPFYTPSIVASLQVVLAIKVLLEKDYLKQGLYFVDLDLLAIEAIKFK